MIHDSVFQGKYYANPIKLYHCNLLNSRNAESNLKALWSIGKTMIPMNGRSVEERKEGHYKK